MSDQEDVGDRTPLVTAAILTYDRPASVGGAIESALAQTFTDFELVVLEDGSTDESAEIAASFRDERLSYERNPVNLGIAGNWNRAFELARGSFVAVLHDDDRWAPNFLEEAIGLFRSCPNMGFAYASAPRYLGLPTTDAILSPPQALDRLRRRCEVGAESVVVRRQAYLETGGFQSRWAYSLDWNLWIRLASRYPVGYLARELGRQGEDEASQRFTNRFNEQPLAIARDKFEMLRNTIPEIPVPEPERQRLLEAALRSLAQAQMVTAWDWAVRGDGRRAREEAAFGFEIDRSVGLTSPHLVAAAYTGSLLSAFPLRRLNRFRTRARAVFRRD